jgi:hypothetical protein
MVCILSFDQTEIMEIKVVGGMGMALSKKEKVDKRLIQRII